MTTGIIENAAVLAGPYWGKTSLRYQFYSVLSATYQGKSPLLNPQVTYDNGAVFGALTSHEQNYALGIFQYISELTGLSFILADAQNPQDIGLAAISIPSNTSLYGQAGDGPNNTINPQGDPKEFVEAGDVWLTGQSRLAQSNSAPLSTQQRHDAFQYTFTHELAHALGLDHSFNGNDYNNAAYPLSSQGNSNKFTIMAYRPHIAEGFHAFDYQLYDILNLQKMYGADSQTRSGSTIYGGAGILAFHERDPNVSTGERQIGGAIAGASDRIFSIWDGSGNDLIDASLYSQPAYVDLRPGHFSKLR